MPTHTHDQGTAELSHPGQTCDQVNVEAKKRLDEGLKELMAKYAPALRRLAEHD